MKQAFPVKVTYPNPTESRVPANLQRCAETNTDPPIFGEPAFT